jgi:hypothetical protein
MRPRFELVIPNRSQWCYWYTNLVDKTSAGKEHSGLMIQCATLNNTAPSRRLQSN